MGALAPVSSWVPEDDVLLKNAIEAGASLESLAKGAVQFSRKYTFKELQDRWHSLLYDPVVSKEASSRMIEFEQCVSANSLKCSRPGNPKEIKSLAGKRKSESVRTCYYAMRKRIRNEPLNSLELDFLVAPPGDNSSFGNEDDSGNCMVGEGISNHLVFEETNCAFLQEGISTDVFPTTMDNPIEEGFSVQAVNIDDNLHCTVGELGNIENLPVDMFEYDGPMMKPSSTFDCINTYRDNASSEFEENRVFNSSVADFNAPFQNLEFSSPLPDMPIWKDEGLSTSTLAADDRFVIAEVVSVQDDGSGHNVRDIESDVYSGILCDPLKDRTGSTEGYLVEITNTLLSDEPFFLDVDGKDAMEKSYYENLSSLLLSSPNDGIQDCIPEISVPEASRDNIPNTAGAFTSEVPVMVSTSASTTTSQQPELTNGVIICTLNTEDPEIPCNDHIILPNKLPPVLGLAAKSKGIRRASNPLPASIKHVSGCQGSGERRPAVMQGDPNRFRQIHATDSQAIGSMRKLEKGQHSIGGCKAKPEDPALVACTTATSAHGGSSVFDSMKSNVGTIQPPIVKDKKEDMPYNHLNHTPSDSFKKQPAAGSHPKFTEQEVVAPATNQNHQAAEARHVNVISAHPIVQPSVEFDELPLESDDDVPYSSDIEAMILDMDLNPENHSLYDLEVAKYQHQDTRKAIIRLEQGARSYIQRAIASHGAFAVLYGRYSKHYIKKPEVLLGRATEDTAVDIDLTREGRGNKVSRRQAIINMEKDGSFHLRNVGRHSVSVNSREIAPGKSFGLSSSCLIEIKGIAFIFETNQTCVKRYLDGLVVLQ